MTRWTVDKLTALQSANIFYKNYTNNVVFSANIFYKKNTKNVFFSANIFYKRYILYILVSEYIL